MNPLFSVFVSKLPTNIMSLLPTGNKFITFLNPYSLFAAREYALKYKEFDYIASDGILPVWMNSLFHVSKTIRCSFDMSGIAGLIFKYAISEKKRIYFWGTTSENLTKFLKVIRQNYPSLLIAGWHHGYVESLEERIWKDIQNSNADIVIIGMGTPKQDLMALKLKEKGISINLSSVYRILDTLVDNNLINKYVLGDTNKTFYEINWNEHKVRTVKMLGRRSI